MISSIDAYSERFLASLRATNEKIERAQRQVASGKKMELSSDDPDGVSPLMETRSQISRAEQINQNLGRLLTEANTASSALEEASKLYDRVRSLATAGANSMVSDDTRKTLADEVGTILGRLVAISNTEVDGRYLFSGDSDSQPAFDFNTANTPAWTFAGSIATRRALHPNGSSFAMAKAGNEIFTSIDPDKNIFATVQNLQTALLSNDQTAINAAIAPMADASAHLNQQISFYGNTLTQIYDGRDYASRLTVQLNAEKADLEDADITEAIVTLQQLKFQQESSLQVRSSVPRRSLFDYLG